jgi:hypothetical protein
MRHPDLDAPVQALEHHRMLPDQPPVRGPILRPIDRAGPVGSKTAPLSLNHVERFVCIDNTGPGHGGARSSDQRCSQPSI